ncbi:2-oxo-4-hydroxy-4-carboxy-5-ureidoimidazoline decarboxylase [Bacillus sp. MRMR6]|uniref:2-oxo-4-hydroxy-4-carboxy-5-ureidoimidazoline decarboxylase n=1 Tax=Bacillus sp. MRMR6 TaxID=1928617 RepID=UPI00095173D1|nr:2-oxo-4-hydroxy-4-carboxy-5-ureidoimidazoline decarboxylase [Bacillus sp. MRMR6]OLS40669.1 OHCU decarboxylase [Bacillus sp. MRMR6]
MYTIEQINQSNHEEFAAITEGIFEHSPWISKKVETAKPFTSLQHLHQEMVAVVENSLPEEKLALIKAHPNLGDRVAMTNHSVQEQKGAGLQNLTSDEYQQFISMNHQYMEKFGFPFILAVRGKNKHEIYEAMETRFQNSKDIEFQTALIEIYKIARLRLEEKISQSFR